MNITWSKYSPLESAISATDPLALEYMAQQLGYIVLPNYTTRTSRARYYSMVCYGLYICEKCLYRMNAPVTDEDILNLFRFYEKYWAYSVVSFYQGSVNSKEYDLRGKNGAIRAYNGRVNSLDESFKLLSRQLELGALGAYRSSLEKCGLIKQSSLALTSRGMELAKKFLPVSDAMRTQYDDLVIESIKDKKIIDQRGNATMRKFGEYARLDRFTADNIDNEERELLKKFIIEGEQITLTSVGFIYAVRDIFNDDVLEALRIISGNKSKSQVENLVIDGFRTIYAYELLSNRLNDIFCKLLSLAFDSGGSCSIIDMLDYIDGDIEEIKANNLVQNLLSSPKYIEMLSFYYFTEFSSFLNQFKSSRDNGLLLTMLLKYHGDVMKKRRSARWLEIMGGTVQANSGFEFIGNAMGRRHTYKMSNVYSLIDDGGWRP